MPQIQPSRKRRSGRGSRPSAHNSGASAKEASQVWFARENVRISRTAVSSASAGLTAVRSLLIHLIRHVGTAHQRPAEHHLETDGKTVVAIGVKLLRSHVLGYFQIPARGLQILPDGGDVHVGGD